MGRVFNMFVEVKRNGHVAGVLMQMDSGEWYMVAVSEEDDTLGHDFTVSGNVGGTIDITVLEGVTDDYAFELHHDDLKFLDEDTVKLTEM